MRQGYVKSLDSPHCGLGFRPFKSPLSCILNVIDGIDAHEGHVLFMTTNNYDLLDEALTRPGRVDLTYNFTLAKRRHAE